MSDISDMIEEIVSAVPLKLVFSNPRKRVADSIATDSADIKKITVRRLEAGNAFQVEKRSATQAFHLNISEADLSGVMETYFREFRQMNVWCETMVYELKESKKGKLLVTRKKEAAGIALAGHNRKKHYILEEGTHIPALVDLGIFTRDGKIVSAMYDKYKQINRFLEMVEDVLKDYDKKHLRVIDFGCGKSYLTFVLYHYLTVIKGKQVDMTGLDLKESVIKRCNETAEKYGYDRLHFELGDINGYDCRGDVDMVVTLHACDTATDYALFNAINWKANIILSVPCCQHELNKQMVSDELSALTKYGIIKERTAALMTDAIRGSLLEYCGYKTQLLEFVDLAHSPKNILLRAVRSNLPEEKRKQALDEVERLCHAFGLEPTLRNMILER